MTDSEHSASRSEAPDDNGPPSALDWARRTGMTSTVMAQLHSLSRRRQRLRFTDFSLAFAAAAAVVLVGVVWLWPDESPTPLMQGGLTVMPPEQRTLPDGSMVDLRDGAQVEVEFSSTMRLVKLQAGTASFKVAHSTERPFVVLVNGVTVRAVGTEFCIALLNGTVDVLVMEGRVAVSANSQSQQAVEAVTPPRQAMLGAGERLVVEMSGAAYLSELRVERISHSDWDSKLGWRLPRFDFLRTPLGEVLDTFNRYNDRQLVLSDQSLAKLKVSGNLRADKVAALLDMLRESFDLRIEDSGQGDILIGR